jgi:hypothetical protein
MWIQRGENSTEASMYGKLAPREIWVESSYQYPVLVKGEWITPRIRKGDRVVQI